jgi:UDP-N-acetylglucosamine/UDP-N-acetylgalactosamine 4-epimerase
MEQTLFHNQDLSDKRFLVTGGAGFIGSNLVDYLIRNNAGRVVVLDNLSNGYYENIKEHVGRSNFEFIEGDIRDIETCRKAAAGIQYISHQAALGSVPRSIENPLLTNEVNISGFLNMLYAAKESKDLIRFIYAASSSTYGDHPGLPKVEDQIGNPLSPYAVTKYVNELYANVFSKVYGIHTIGLRYFNVFGPKQSPDNPYAAVIPLFMRAALQQTAPSINGDGETSRDFTYVENAVQANIKALLKTDELTVNEVYNIAFGEQTTLNQLWQMIAESMEASSITPVYLPERRGDIKHSLADISKAKKGLNYQPGVSVAKGIQLLSDYYKTKQ